MPNIFQKHKKAFVLVSFLATTAIAVAVFLTLFPINAAQGSGKSGYVITKTVYYENGKVSHTTINDLDGYGNPIKTVTDYENGFESEYIDKHSEATRSFDKYGIIKSSGVNASFYVEAYNDMGLPEEIVKKHDDIVTNTTLEFYSSGRVKAKNEITKYPSGDADVFHFEFDEAGFMTLYRSSFSRSDVGGEITYEYERDDSGKIIGCKETEHLPKSKQYKSGNAVVTGRITNYIYEYDDEGNIIQIKKDGKIDREFSYAYFSDLSEWAWLRANLFPPISIG